VPRVADIEGNEFARRLRPPERDPPSKPLIFSDRKQKRLRRRAQGGWRARRGEAHNGRSARLARGTGCGIFARRDHLVRQPAKLILCPVERKGCPVCVVRHWRDFAEFAVAHVDENVQIGGRAKTRYSLSGCHLCRLSLMISLGFNCSATSAAQASPCRHRFGNC